MNLRNRHGSSLIELAVAISVTTLLTGIILRTLVMMQTWQSQQQTLQQQVSAAERLAIDFRRDLARGSAIEEDTTSLTIHDRDGQVIAVYDWGSPEDGFLERAPERYAIGKSARVRLAVGDAIHLDSVDGENLPSPSRSWCALVITGVAGLERQGNVSPLEILGRLDS
ncbi:MAG: hypothetical protein AAF958_10500, partial [Planctomycetota bacterium]